MIDKKMAEKEFRKLSGHEKNNLVGYLHHIRMGYEPLRANVDIPYYFWSLNKHMFLTDEEREEYLNIKTVEDFSSQTIFYIARYINNTRRSNNNG